MAVSRKTVQNRLARADEALRQLNEEGPLAKRA